MPEQTPAPAGDAALDPAIAAIAAIRVVPVLTLGEASAAGRLAMALKAGGLPCAEVTLRTAAALDAIRAMAADPDMLVGAGTVITPAQAEEAVAAGARFIVSPGFDLEIVGACRRLSVPAIPGVATATEIQMALRAGIGIVKLFPAEALGGLATLKALSAPFPDVRFIPTGGVTPENAVGYLGHPAVLAVGGSWIAPGPLVAAGRFDEIARLARHAASLAAPRGTEP